MNRRTRTISMLIGIAILSSAIIVLPKLGFAQSVIVVNPLARGVKCDGISNDAPAIQEIIDAIPVTDPAGGDILFPPAVVCAIGSQITINGKNALRIIGTGGDTASDGFGSKGGTQFKWMGHDNEIMVKFFDVRRTTFSGFTLDANGRANITGILWDGDNKLPSSSNEFGTLLCIMRILACR